MIITWILYRKIFTFGSSNFYFGILTLSFVKVTSVHLGHDHFLKDMAKHKVPTGARLRRRMKSFHMGVNDFRNELEIPFLCSMYNFNYRMKVLFSLSLESEICSRKYFESSIEDCLTGLSSNCIFIKIKMLVDHPKI